MRTIVTNYPKISELGLAIGRDARKIDHDLASGQRNSGGQHPSLSKLYRVITIIHVREVLS